SPTSPSFVLLFFLLLILLPPISTLFPYTTLFRSVAEHRSIGSLVAGRGVCFRIVLNPLFGSKCLFPVLVCLNLCGGRFRGCVLLDRKSTRLNSSHDQISYAVFCLKKKTSNVTLPT